MIGQRISPILDEIEMTLWEFEARDLGQPHFTDDGFRASIKIFMSTMLDKMWNLQSNENIDQLDREQMATKLGEDVRKLIKIYTGIDSHKLYENTSKTGI